MDHEISEELQCNRPQLGKWQLTWGCAGNAEQDSSIMTDL